MYLLPGSVLEDPTLLVTTDAYGRYAFDYPAGRNVTLFAAPHGYHPTQTPTVTVPPAGLVGKHGELTFQVPRVITFDVLEEILPRRIVPGHCHVVVTVAARNKTMDDKPQGEAEATCALDPLPPTADAPFYFGMFAINDDTNPFKRGLKATR